MLIEFIKYCPWSFGNKIIKFKKGDQKNVDDKNASEMIKHGYAMPFEDMVREKEIIEADLTERYDLYANRFKAADLKAFAEKHKIPMKSGYKTRPYIINQIIEFEREHGQIKIRGLK